MFQGKTTTQAKNILKWFQLNKVTILMEQWLFYAAVDGYMNRNV